MLHNLPARQERWRGTKQYQKQVRMGVKGPSGSFDIGYPRVNEESIYGMLQAVSMRGYRKKGTMH